jgi:hypothetical protein
MAIVVAKKPVGILAEMVVGKRPSVTKEPESSPDMEDAEESDEDPIGASPEEREALGTSLADAVKGGDASAIYDAVEAIVRSCKGSY